MSMGLIKTLHKQVITLLLVGALSIASAAHGETFRLQDHSGVVLKTGNGRLDRWTLRRAHPSKSTITLSSIILPKGRYRASIRSIERQGSAPALFSNDLCPNSVFALNGGFYWRQGAKLKPLGLVRVGRRMLSKPSLRRSGGVLAVRDGVVQVVRRKDMAIALGADDAIESTPLLVEDERSGIRSDDGARFDRVAIGVGRSGALVAVGAFGRDQDGLTLSEFSVVARDAARAQGETIAWLLALDGGPSAHIRLARPAMLLGSRGPMYLPNAICVAAR